MNHDLPIIDVHTHVHATREDAHAFLSLLSPQLAETDRASSIDESLAMMDTLGVQTTLILPWVFAQMIYAQRLQDAGKPPDVDDEALKDEIAADWAVYNEWAITAARRHPGRYAALCAVDPILLGERRTRVQIEHGLALGALGLKIVPSFMNAHPYDERMAIVWQEADRRGLPVTAQCSGPRDGFAHPAHFEEVLRSYPNCSVVLAHMGLGGGEEEVVRLASKYPNVYGDTSSWLGNVGRPGQQSPDEAVALFRRIGTDRVLYGSNYPITDAVEFVQILRSLPLLEDEQRQIFSENARRAFPGIGNY